MTQPYFFLANLKFSLDQTQFLDLNNFSTASSSDMPWKEDEFSKKNWEIISQDFSLEDLKYILSSNALAFYNITTFHLLSRADK